MAKKKGPTPAPGAASTIPAAPPPVMPTAPTINRGATFGSWGTADPAARASMQAQWDANRQAVSSYNDQYSAYQDQMRAREIATQQAMMQAQMTQPAPAGAAPVGGPLNPTAVPVSPTGQLQATKGPVSVYGENAPKGARPGILTTKKAGYVVQPGAQRQAGARYGPYVEEQFRAQERRRAINQAYRRPQSTAPSTEYY